MKRRTSAPMSLLLVVMLAIGSFVSLAGAQATPQAESPATPVTDLPVTPVTDLPVTPGASLGCTAGSVGIGDRYFPTMGNGGYDVQHYDLDLTLDVSGSEILAGVTTIEAFALADLCSFNLDFEGLTIESVTVNGVAAEFSRHYKELTITPEEPITYGSTFITTVTYSGSPIQASLESNLDDDLDEPIDLDPSEGIGGGDSGEMDAIDSGWFTAEDEIFIIGEPSGSRFWYPVNEHPLDKATYTASYTVPNPFIVVANGTLISETDHGDTTTYVWDSRDPMASYLVTFHAGLLDVEELEGPNGLPVRLAFAPTVPEAQREVFRKIPAMMEFAETVFGPYPFESIGATVASPEFTFALETQTIPIYGAMADSRDAQVSEFELLQQELTIFHEIAHQWYGNSVSLQNWSDIWLNEGFAAYSEALWLEHTQGSESRDDHLMGFYVLNEISSQFNDPDQVGDLTAQDVIEALHEIGECVDQECMDFLLPFMGAESEADLAGISAETALEVLDDLGIPAEYFPGLLLLTGNPGPSNLFSWGAVYGRGSLTLHALRLEIGDEAFFELVREWPARYHNGNASTVDFILLAEEISGQDLDAFFDAWLFQIALPALDLSGAELSAPFTVAA